MSKVVLVTGSSSGLGLELARILAEKKHIVYISARNETLGKEILESFHVEGLKTAKFVHLDVTKPETIQSAFAIISAAEGRLDALVNNAGIAGSLDQMGQTPSIATIREVMETNYYGAVQTTNTFLPLLKLSESAAILNVSSEMASNTRQSGPDREADFVAYASSKAALNSYTIVLARELKEVGISVNAATPGFTDTKMTSFLEGGKSAREGAEILLPYVFCGGKDGQTGNFYGPIGEEFPW